SVWGQLTFTWNVPTNASSYNLQISTQPDFSVILYDEVTAAKTLTKVLTDYNTRFYWRVKAVYPDCETEFSSIRTFRTAYAPPHNLYPPKDTFCHSNTVLFKWDAVNGATTYRLQVSQSDSLDLNLIVLDTLINTRQFTYYFDKSLQKYSWRVRAEDKQNVGLWSDTMRFQTTYAPPKHLNPMNGDETNITVKFVWTKDVPGSTFELQVSDTNNFNLIQRRIFDFSGLITDTIVLKLPHFNRKYWWRVRASDAYCRSDWSTPTYFRTKLQKPILTFPPNNSTKMPLKVTFEWTKPEGWESFEIHISKDAQFTSLFAGRTGIATNSVTIADFDQSTQYFWRVRAINKEDTSRWSDVFKFTTGPNPLEIPNLIYPTNNGENLPTNVSFTWSSVPRAKYYQLQIAEDLQFTQKILEYLNISDTTYLVSDLKPMSEYFWRVLAYNDSTTSNWSPIWRFRTQPPIPKGPVFLSIPPNETKGVDVSLSLIWSPVQYAEMYHLQVAKDENFVAQSLVLNDSNLIMPQKYLTGLEYNTKYFWHVRAYNSAGSTSWSDTWWFQTMVSSVGEENNVFLLSFNPNENNLTLTFQEGFLEAINIRLFDLFGRVVFSSQLLEDRNSITIPCDKLSKGVYFLHIISKEKSFVARITI
ncbi:MAG: T9SS type A sorting domain-containing protein, partial [Ignavibacteria bacterium]|nr:T9SS type A sorting domain-containing protein [Ignavibacteria bacterium]